MTRMLAPEQVLRQWLPASKIGNWSRSAIGFQNVHRRAAGQTISQLLQVVERDADASTLMSSLRKPDTQLGAWLRSAGLGL